MQRLMPSRKTPPASLPCSPRKFTWKTRSPSQQLRRKVTSAKCSSRKACAKHELELAMPVVPLLSDCDARKLSSTMDLLAPPAPRVRSRTPLRMHCLISAKTRWLLRRSSSPSLRPASLPPPRSSQGRQRRSRALNFWMMAARKSSGFAGMAASATNLVCRSEADGEKCAGSTSSTLPCCCSARSLNQRTSAASVAGVQRSSAAAAEKGRCALLGVGASTMVISR
mmetsp:Transcript_12451/g.37407  ORF Transcript_12451/g.37407 Transcript_12451/m.37407 type:complete len:225 (-) Transcript_12451:144-818(-)